MSLGIEIMAATFRSTKFSQSLHSFRLKEPENHLPISHSLLMNFLFQTIKSRPKQTLYPETLALCQEKFQMSFKIKIQTEP